jgi:hypothetical protein
VRIGIVNIAPLRRGRSVIAGMSVSRGDAVVYGCRPAGSAGDHPLLSSLARGADVVTPSRTATVKTL